MPWEHADYIGQDVHGHAHAFTDQNHYSTFLGVTKQYLKKILGYLCIVKINSIPCLTRGAVGISEGVFTLTCMNQQTTVQESIMRDVKLLSAAPICWIRKVNLSKEIINNKYQNNISV